METKNEKPSTTSFIKTIIDDFNHLHPSTELIIGIGISLLSSLVLGLPLNIVGLLLIGHAYYKRTKLNHKEIRTWRRQQ